MTTKIDDKETMVGVLMVEFISIEPLVMKADKAKQWAVERYMRAYLRGLTPPELEQELKWSEDNNDLSPLVREVIIKASDGYDRYMARRVKVVVA